MNLVTNLIIINGIAGNAVKRYHALLVTFFCRELLRR